MNYDNKLIIPFTYVLSTVAIAGNGNTTATLTMAADSSFELLAIMASSSVDGASNTMPNNFSVLIQDQSTGRYLANARVPQRCLAGVTGNGWGAVEKYPIRFPASCVLTFDVLELSGGTNTVTFCLKGYKLYNTALVG